MTWGVQGSEYFLQRPGSLTLLWPRPLLCLGKQVGEGPWAGRPWPMLLPFPWFQVSQGLGQNSCRNLGHYCCVVALGRCPGEQTIWVKFQLGGHSLGGRSPSCGALRVLRQYICSPLGVACFGQSGELYNVLVAHIFNSPCTKTNKTQKTADPRPPW